MRGQTWRCSSSKLRSLHHVEGSSCSPCPLRLGLEQQGGHRLKHWLYDGLSFMEHLGNCCYLGYFRVSATCGAADTALSWREGRGDVSSTPLLRFPHHTNIHRMGVTELRKVEIRLQRAQVCWIACWQDRFHYKNWKNLQRELETSVEAHWASGR